MASWRSLVHGIVDAVVRLGAHDEFVALVGHAVALQIVLEEGEGLVLGVAVNHHVLHVGIVLLLDAPYGAFDVAGGVVGNGGDGEFQGAVGLVLRSGRFRDRVGDIEVRVKGYGLGVKGYGFSEGLSCQRLGVEAGVL